MENVANYILEKQLEIKPSSMWFAWNNREGAIDKVCLIGEKDGKQRKLIEIDAKSFNTMFYTGPKKDYYNFEMKKKTIEVSLLLNISNVTLEKKSKKLNRITLFSGKILNVEEYKYIFDHILLAVYSEKNNLPIAVEKVVSF